MSEYIKREDAEQSIVGYFVPQTYDGNDIDRVFKIAEAILNNIPSADVVEVRHGHWEKLQGDSRCRCSFCKCRELVPTCNGEPIIWDYCPNCGAKMDREENSNEHTD